MKLTPEIAKEITARARAVLGRKIVVTDPQGVTVTGDNRSDNIMVEALRACQEGRVVRSTEGEHSTAWCPFVYEQQTIGAFGIPEEEVQVTPEAISLLQGLAEVITHQHFLMEHVQPSEKLQAGFLHQVLTGANIEPSEIFRQADILQLNLRVPQAVMLMEIDDFEQDIIKRHTDLPLDEREDKIHHQAQAVVARVKSAFRNNPDNTVSYFGGNLFLISKGIGGEGLTTRNTTRFLREKADYIAEIMRLELPKSEITIGCGQYYPDLGGLRKSYQEAKLSLRVGSRVWGKGRVYHIKDVGMFVTLANIGQEHKAELAHQILYPLLKDEQLHKTVQTFLSSGLNLTDAAQRLHIHRNTLIYRLDKTKKLIGLDPRVFDDALQIKLGLMFYQEAVV